MLKSLGIYICIFYGVGLKYFQLVSRSDNFNVHFISSKEPIKVGKYISFEINSFELNEDKFRLLKINSIITSLSSDQ